jgi:fructose-1,6-bisphosphatase/inositol monophosphatase family enzyme
MKLTLLEQLCLDSFRRSAECWPENGHHGNDDAWIQFALAGVLHAGRLVREVRVAPMSGQATFKADATPVTEREREIEQIIKAKLSAFCPDAVFVGEESGGQLQAHGITVAVDPVDGTWALLNRMSTCSLVIAAFREGKPFLGAVGNPATGEISYAIAGRPTRLLQLDLFGEQDFATDMPLDRASASSILVNVHPSRHAGPLVDHLMSSWQSGQIRMLRMEGGSPTAALLEAAKGTFVYANLWDKRPSEPFDLAAGIMLVVNAGGRVVDLAGRDIDCSSHAGPFVAGVHQDALEQVVSAVASTQS